MLLSLFITISDEQKRLDHDFTTHMPDLFKLGTNPDLLMLGTNPDLLMLGTNLDLLMLGTNPDLLMLGTNPDLFMLGTNRLPIGNWPKTGSDHHHVFSDIDD